MTIWEIMIEDVRNEIISMFKPKNALEFIEDMNLLLEHDSFDKYLDEYGCFQYDDFICKMVNGKITKTYFLYEIHATNVFGDNNELLLIVGHEKAAVINRNTLEEVVSLYHH